MSLAHTLSQPLDSEPALGSPPPGMAGSDTRSWSDATGVVRARLDNVLHTPVVRIVAELDRHALRPCRQALDQALAASPLGVVVDLSLTREATPITVAFLGCMRRYVHARGGELVLLSVPVRLRDALDRVHVLPLYLLAATAPQAVALLRSCTTCRPAPVTHAAIRDDGDQAFPGRASGPACCVGCLDCS